MLRHGAESFELYSGLTDNSSEIECLFIERMKQLLRVGGWAGVILPSSMLSNGGIYSRARDIVFKYFNVKAIVELGSGTFMETGTNTVILFLERRSDSDHEKIIQAINAFFTNKRDVAVSGIERAFSIYVASVYDDLGYEDYVSFISENANDAMREHELYKDYVKEFGDVPYAKAFEVEKEKMLYFFLTHNQNIVVAKSGQKQDEKAFLGYEFSKRRGYEGIKILPLGTMLFDENGDISNLQKVNSYIYNAFLEKDTLSVDAAVSNHVSYGCMSGFFEYGTSKFSKRVNLSKKGRVMLFSKHYELVALGEISNITKGQTITSAQVLGGSIPVVAGGIEPSITHNVANREADIISVSASGANAGFIRYWDVQIFASDCNTIKSKNDNKVLTKYLYFCLKHMQNDIFGLQSGQAQPHIYEKDLSGIKIPVPAIDVQQKIVSEFEEISKKIRAVEERITFTQQSIESKFLELFGDPVSNSMGWQTKKLAEVTTKIGSGATPKGGESSYVSSGISLIRSMNVYNGYFKYNGLAYITDEQAKQLDGVTVQENDILLNITGASVARTCVVPSDILPARVNQHVSIIRCDSTQLNYVFANAALTTESYQQLLISIGEAAGMSRQAITKSQIENLSMILPPIEAQDDFANFSRKTYEAIANYQQNLDKAIKNRDIILHKYL